MIPWKDIEDFAKAVIASGPIRLTDIPPVLTHAHIREWAEKGDPHLLPIEFEDGYGLTIIRAACAPSEWMRNMIELHRCVGWQVIWEIWP